MQADINEKEGSSDVCYLWVWRQLSYEIFVVGSSIVDCYLLNKIRGTTALKSQDRLKWLLPDGSTGGLVVSKVLSLNLNFSFLNHIPLLLISSSYPIVLTRLGGPHSRPYTSRKISRVLPESNPGPLGWQSGMLTTIPNRRSLLSLVL